MAKKTKIKPKNKAAKKGDSLPNPYTAKKLSQR